MPRFLPTILACMALSLVISCDKDDAPSEEAIFHGTWVKGPNHGDTLYFYKKSGKNIVASNQSFNALIYAPTEQEYKYENGKLFIRTPRGAGSFAEIEFAWKVPNQSFEIRGYQLFMFMSSTLTQFTYTKVK